MRSVALHAENITLRDDRGQVVLQNNTVIYRLEGVMGILAMDLKNPEIQLQLQLALKLH